MCEYVFKFVSQCIHVFLYLFRDFQRERLNDFVDVLWLMVMFVCNVHTAQNTLSKNDSTHSELIMGTMLHIPTIWRTHEFYHTRIFLRRYMSSKCARITSNTSAYYISFHQDHQYLHKKKCVLLIAHLLIYRWQTDSVVSLDDCLAVGKLVVSRDGRKVSHHLVEAIVERV